MIYAIFNFLIIPTCYLFLPETAGLSLEQLDGLFRGGKVQIRRTTRVDLKIQEGQGENESIGSVEKVWKWMRFTEDKGFGIRSGLVPVNCQSNISEISFCQCFHLARMRYTNALLTRSRESQTMHYEIERAKKNSKFKCLPFSETLNWFGKWERQIPDREKGGYW